MDALRAIRLGISISSCIRHIRLIVDGSVRLYMQKSQFSSCEWSRMVLEVDARSPTMRRAHHMRSRFVMMKVPGDMKLQ